MYWIQHFSCILLYSMYRFCLFKDKLIDNRGVCGFSLHRLRVGEWNIPATRQLFFEKFDHKMTYDKIIVKSIGKEFSFNFFKTHQNQIMTHPNSDATNQSFIF